MPIHHWLQLALTDGIGPVLSRRLIDATGSVAAALVDHRRNELPWLVAAILGLGVIRAVMMAGRRLIAGKQALYVEMDVRTAVYAKLVRLSFGFYDRHQTGQLMSRATVDLQGVRFFLGYGLIFFFQHVFTILGVGIFVFLISWKLALIAIAISPVLIAVAYRYSHVSHPLLRDVQQKMADVATVAEENIVGVHVVKAFAQEEEQQRKFERSSEEVFQLSVKANRQRAFYIPLLSFLPLLPSQILLNNLLYDASQLTIPTDRVDPEQLQAPSHWDISFIRRFMLFFGPISSLFDFFTFALMLGVFHAGPALFRAGWFAESLATQTLVIFAIRTRRSPFTRSRPTPYAVASAGADTSGVVS